MGYTVGDVAEQAKKYGVDASATDADVNSKLGLAKKGAAGTFWDKEDDRAVANAEKLTKEGFGGSGHKVGEFLGRIDGKPAIAGLDFNDAVESGTATRLAKLSRENPAAFDDIVNRPEPYKSTAELDRAINDANAVMLAKNAPAKTSPEQTTPGQAAPHHGPGHGPIKSEPVKNEPVIVAEHKAPAHTSSSPSAPVAASNTGPGAFGDHVITDLTHIATDMRAALAATGAPPAVLGTMDKVVDTLKDFANGGQIITAGNIPLLSQVMDVMAGLKLDDIMRFDANGKEPLPTGINPGPNLPDPMAGLQNNTFKLS